MNATPTARGRRRFWFALISGRLTIADAHCVRNIRHKKATDGSVEKMDKTEEAQTLAYRAAKIDAMKR